MDLRIMVEPQQGASFEQQLLMAQVAEASGFTGFFRSDHYLKITGEEGLPGPTDTWVTLGAIARETTTIRLGTMVCAITFRLPGPLAVAAAQVDNMSNGRVELGIGAAWYPDEHAAYGIPFPTTKQRFDMLEEQLEIVTGLWRSPLGGEFTFIGDHYNIVGSPGLPKPTQPGGPPIIIGGFGAKRTPDLAAKFAAEFNVPFASVEDFRKQRQRVRDACEEIARTPDDITFSAALVLCCGENAEEVERRAGAIGEPVEMLKLKGAVGSPAEVLDTIAAYSEAGADRIYLQTLDFDDLDHIRLVGDRVLKMIP